jgi:hypothetical protein
MATVFRLAANLAPAQLQPAQLMLVVAAIASVSANCR